MCSLTEPMKQFEDYAWKLQVDGNITYKKAIILYRYKQNYAIM